MLRIFLLANCASCTVFGIVFVSFAATTAAFIGTPPTLVVTGLGGLLLVNAVLLALTVLRRDTHPALIAFFVVGDIGWVILTIACLALGVWIQGPTAIAASIAIATLVAGLGYGQYVFGVKGKLSQQT
ncbi:MAG: hypothetical protein ACSHWY_11385 [Octadecabacter sp.]